MSDTETKRRKVETQVAHARENMLSEEEETLRHNSPAEYQVESTHASSAWKESLSRLKAELEDEDAALSRSALELEEETRFFEEQERLVQERKLLAGDIVTFNVGGVHHSISKSIIMKQPQSMLCRLVTCDNVQRDAAGRIELDRDSHVFRHILNYLRGYKSQLSSSELGMVLYDLDYYGLDALADVVRSQTSPPANAFQYGGGTNLERNRFRSHYSVSLLGEHFYMQGKHSVTFEIRRCEYVGLGVISDYCVSLDQEFHKTTHCCVYYMTGVFYSNYPHHKKEEGWRNSGRWIASPLIWTWRRRPLRFASKTE